MENTDKIMAFVAEYEALCKKHELYIDANYSGDLRVVETDENSSGFMFTIEELRRRISNNGHTQGML